jgi:hypothetical protein
MQSWLLWCILADWVNTFCMVCIIYKRSVVPRNQYRGLLLSVFGMERKIFYIVRKGEKQIQILDDY